MQFKGKFIQWEREGENLTGTLKAINEKKNGGWYIVLDSLEHGVVYHGINHINQYEFNKKFIGKLVIMRCESLSPYRVTTTEVESSNDVQTGLTDYMEDIEEVGSYDDYIIKENAKDYLSERRMELERELGIIKYMQELLR